MQNKEKIIFPSTIFINVILAINIISVIALIPISIWGHNFSKGFVLGVFGIVLPLLTSLLVNKTHFSDISNRRDLKDYNHNSDKHLFLIIVSSGIFNALPMFGLIYIIFNHPLFGFSVFISLLYSLYIFAITWASTIFFTLVKGSNLPAKKTQHYYDEYSLDNDGI